eukprot:m.144969 g.144969  ORF g.144969 m.144969 type:complete len:1801 (+) comp14135_c1_seq12:190-5592(+)
MSVPSPHLIPGTHFVVDNFNDPKLQQQGNLFFLSHFHADHYGKLSHKTWSGHNQIYCSPITRALVIGILGLAEENVVAIPLNQAIDVAGHRVMATDAGHCPGAVMLWFCVRKHEASVTGDTADTWHLHTGDCRFSSEWQSLPCLNPLPPISSMFLDTTYCHPKHTFPRNELAAQFVADTVARELAGPDQDNVLVLIAAYTIGKEKIMLKVNEKTSKRVYVNERKYDILQKLELGVNLSQVFTTKMEETNIQVVAWNTIGDPAPGGWTVFPRYQDMHDMLDHFSPRFTRVVAFIPTGWTHAISQATVAQGDFPHHCEVKNKVTVYSVPYSEHSSFPELVDFVKWIRPARVIPTVGGTSLTQFNKLCSYFDRWTNKAAAGKQFFAGVYKRQASIEKAGDGDRASLTTVKTGDGSPVQKASKQRSSPSRDVLRKQQGVPSPSSTPTPLAFGVAKSPLLSPHLDANVPAVRIARKKFRRASESRITSLAQPSGGISNAEIVTISATDKAKDWDVQLEPHLAQRGDKGYGQCQRGDDEDVFVIEKSGESALKTRSSASIQPSSSSIVQTTSDELVSSSTGSMGKEKRRRTRSSRVARKACVSRSASASSDLTQHAQTRSEFQDSDSDTDASQPLLAFASVPFLSQSVDVVQSTSTKASSGSTLPSLPPTEAVEADTMPTQALATQQAAAQIHSLQPARTRSLTPQLPDSSAPVEVCDVQSDEDIPTPARPTAIDVGGAAGGEADEAGVAQCPVCDKTFLVTKMNLHLDECLSAPLLKQFGANTEVVVAPFVVSKTTDKGDHTSDADPTYATSGSHHTASSLTPNAVTGSIVLNASPPRSQRSPPRTYSQSTPTKGKLAGLQHPSVPKRQLSITSWLSPSRKPKIAQRPPASKSTETAKASARTSLFGGSTLETKPKLPKLDPSLVEPSDASPCASLRMPVTGTESDLSDASVTAAGSVTLARKQGDAKLPYRLVADALEQLIVTTSRLKITSILADLFVEVYTQAKTAGHAHPAEPVLATVYLCSNEIAPAYHNVELGVGESTVAAVVMEATGMSKAQLRKRYQQHGDLGDVAHSAKAHVRTLFKPKPLTIQGVFKALHQIAKMQGSGSTKRRKDIIRSLIVSCQGPETRFIVRTLISNLRSGAVGLTLRTAVAHAAMRIWKRPSSEKDTYAQLVKDIYAQHPDWNDIIPSLFERGFEHLQATCGVAPGVPVLPMLGKITRNLVDALHVFNSRDFQAEYKYDGVRAQIHIVAPDALRAKAKCFMFSRHLENVTPRYPDGLRAVLDSLTNPTDATRLVVSSCILDAEIVAVDAAGAILSFQTLMSRPKLNVVEKDLEVAVKVFVYDMMEVNGQAMLEFPFRTRTSWLQQVIQPIDNRIQCAVSKQFFMTKGETQVVSTREHVSSKKASKKGKLTHKGKDQRMLKQSVSQVDAAVSADSATRATTEEVIELSDDDDGGGDESESEIEATEEGDMEDMDALLCGEPTAATAEAIDATQTVTTITSAPSLQSSLKQIPRSPSRALVLGEGESVPGDGSRMSSTGSDDDFVDVEVGVEPFSDELTEEVRQFFLDSFKAKCEGLMLKALGPITHTKRHPTPPPPQLSSSSPTTTTTTTLLHRPHTKMRSPSDDDFALSTYQPSKRCENWLKVKKDYVQGISDSLDLVVIGAWWGNGRKAGWFSPFLLACYNPDNQQYESVCKVMSGFTDEFYKEMTDYFKQKTIPSKRADYRVNDAMHPTVWFEATDVWEIKGANFTISPVHTAALGRIPRHPSQGVSIRFPRFIRKREDRASNEATTSADILDMFEQEHS